VFFSAARDTVEKRRHRREIGEMEVDWWGRRNKHRTWQLTKKRNSTLLTFVCLEYVTDTSTIQITHEDNR